tara:strand:- start:22064 stop:23230 length:1167 start_codon:yes stop_codon:yes gene_type:complete
MEVKFTDLVSQWSEAKKGILSKIGDLVDESSFVRGPSLDAFESNFSKYTNKQHTIGTSSGTAALISILQGLDLSPGNRVGIQSNTFISTAFAAEHANLEVVLIDNWKSLLNSPNDLELDCVIPVHMYGYVNTTLMEDLLSWCQINGVILVEDACQAIGAESVGTYGVATAYSFYPTKNLGCWGQGGAVTTNNSRLAKFIRAYINQGQSSKYIHNIVGDNLRLHPIQAIVLNEGLKHIDAWNDSRRNIANIYLNRLSDLGDVRPLLNPQNSDTVRKEYGKNYVFHLYPLLIDYTYPKVVEDLQQYLSGYDIETDRNYPFEIASQKPYRLLYDPTPFAAYISRHSLSLPIHPFMNADQANYVCDKLGDWVDAASAREVRYRNIYTRENIA